MKLQQKHKKPVLFAAAAMSVVVIAALVMNSHHAQEKKEESAQAAITSPAPTVLKFATGAPQLAQIRLEKAEVSPIPLAEPLAARISYNEDATVRFFPPVAGRVTQVNAQIGDTVKPGQGLITLDAPELGAALADNAKAAADVAQKQSSLHRAEILFQGEALSRRDLESARTEAAQAAAEAERAKLRLSNLTRGMEAQGETLVLRSPIAGVVAERNASPGLEARPDLDKPLLVVANLKKLTVNIDVPEKDLAQIVVGQRIKVEASAYQNRSFEGRVERISPVIDPATRRVQVRSSVDNSDGLLKPEMYVRVSLIADSHHEGVRIPLNALLVEGLKNFIFVEKEPGVLEKREVTVELQTREYAYTSKGVVGGESVVAAGALLLNAELASQNSQGR